MKQILNKLHKIMKEASFIQKDKKNDFHGYKYASEEIIKVTLHSLLVSNGVLFLLEANNLRREGTVTDIDFKYTFYDVESGENISGTFVGTGEDKLDKGTYKAITGAIKYILTSSFLIPTGNDPEDDSPKTKPVSKLPTKAVEIKGVPQCDNCGKEFVLKQGQYGDFYSCSGYPKCKNTLKAQQKRNISKVTTEIPMEEPPIYGEY